MTRCFFLPEGKLNEKTGKLRVASKNEDEGIIQYLAQQGVTGANAAIFYAKGSRPAQLTARKVARECTTAKPIALEWLASGKTTLAAFRGAVPNLKEMEPTIQFAIFIGTKGFLAQIAEEHEVPWVHMAEGDVVLELDTTNGTCTQRKVSPVDDDSVDENGDDEEKTDGAS